MSELPSGWVLTDFDAVTLPVSKNGPNKDDDKDIWYVDISSIDNKANRIAEPQRLRLKLAPSRARQIIKEGDVLFSLVRPYLRKIAPVTTKFDGEVASTGFAVLRPAKDVLPGYLLARALYNEFVTALSGEQYGVSYPAVKEEQVKAQPFPLPPTNEQRRIVEKIETLFADLDAGVESLTRARARLALYRQSVLKAAFEGRLTADWRAENPDKLEDPETLLVRIEKERAARYKQALDDWQEALAAWRANGGKGKKPSKPRRPADPVEIEAGELPALPHEWGWVSLDELVSGRSRSMQSGPFGSTLKHSEFTSEGVLVVGIDNVGRGEFSMGNRNRISPRKYETLKKYTARPGDLLITVMASLGKSCVIPDDLETAIITKHVYRISMEQYLLCPIFYNLLLQTEWVTRHRMFKNAQGQTRPGLNSDILRALPVPLLTFAEQTEIIRRLETKLSNIDALEAQIDDGLARSKALRQSILKRAFAGKLVAQDPSDEPAHILLDRIKAEKAVAAPKMKRRRA